VTERSNRLDIPEQVCKPFGADWDVLNADAFVLGRQPPRLFFDSFSGPPACSPRWAAVTGRLILDHFRNPRNAGYIDDADGIGFEKENPWRIAVQISLKVRKGMIHDIRFRAQGCVTSIACASVMTEIVRGKPLEEAHSVSPRDLSEALEHVPEEKAHCCRLSIRALHLALADYCAQRFPDPLNIPTCHTEEDANR
jgi:nitrogen fixation protein NifU and related proteins